MDILSDGPLEEFKHTFLIRNPAKALSSLYKVHKAIHDERKYGGNIHLFQHLYKMYTFVQQKLDPCPVVIDADDLLCDPEGIMKSTVLLLGFPAKKV